MGRRFEVQCDMRFFAARTGLSFLAGSVPPGFVSRDVSQRRMKSLGEV